MKMRDKYTGNGLSDLLKALSQESVEVSMQDGNLKLRYDGELSKGLIDEIRLKKKELLQYLAKYSESEDYADIMPVDKNRDYELSHAQKEMWTINKLESDISGYNMHSTLEYEEDLYDLSPSQKRLWLLNKIDRKTSAYNMMGNIDFSLDLNISLLTESLNLVVERHENLRTIFVEKEGLPFQKILSNQKVDIEIVSKQDKAQTENETSDPSIELDKWPLFKFVLIKLENEYKLLFVMHHIITDGWSMEVLTREILNIYESKLNRRELTLPDLPIQYKDYAHWQNNLWRDGEISKQERYWIEKLSGVIPNLRLPIDILTQAHYSKKEGSFYTVFLNEELKKKINRIQRDKKISLFSFFISTFKILLYRITSETDLVIGTPVANRSHHQIKDLIGFFLNTVMFRDQLDKQDSFDKFLHAVNTTLIEGLENQDYPFELLLEKLNIPREYNHFPQ